MIESVPMLTITRTRRRLKPAEISEDVLGSISRRHPRGGRGDATIRIMNALVYRSFVDLGWADVAVGAECDLCFLPTWGQGNRLRPCGSFIV